jgi:hypothetical protein
MLHLITQRYTYNVGAGGADRVAVDEGLGRVLVARFHRLWGRVEEQNVEH